MIALSHSEHVAGSSHGGLPAAVTRPGLVENTVDVQLESGVWIGWDADAAAFVER